MVQWPDHIDALGADTVAHGEQTCLVSNMEGEMLHRARCAVSSTGPGMGDTKVIGVAAVSGNCTSEK
jgi:hypothetical protein